MTHRKIFLIALWLVIFQQLFSQSDNNTLMPILSQSINSGLFDSVILNKDKHRLQIIYTQIDRDAQNNPTLKTYKLNAGNYYHYCASTIKLPMAILALEKINSLNSYNISKYDSISIDSIFCSDLGTDMLLDNIAGSSVAQCIKEILLVSNNNAYNPLFDFVGSQAANKRLTDLGYPTARIAHRFSPCDTFANKKTNPLTFYSKLGSVKYHQSSLKNPAYPIYNGSLSPLVGVAYVGKSMIIPRPKDFSTSNYLALADMHDMVTKIFFPQFQSIDKKWNLTKNDYSFLKKYMGMYPRESANPVYNPTEFPDNYVKYFVKPDGQNSQLPDNIRVFNKVGMAYGFLTDCAYVIDTLNKVEFLLSASIYVNQNNILNDGKYEYDQIGYPFLQELFNTIYKLELMRDKKNKPKFEPLDFNDKNSIVTIDEGSKPTKQNLTEEDIENNLVTLYNDGKTNKDNQAIFAKEFVKTLSDKRFANYKFQKLKQENIQIISNENNLFHCYIWKYDNTSEQYVALQTSNPAKENAVTQYTYTNGNAIENAKIYSFKSGIAPIYLLETWLENTNGTKSQMLSAFTEKDNTIVSTPVFKISNNEIYSELYTPMTSEKKTSIKVDVNKAIIYFPKYYSMKNKTKVTVLKLKLTNDIFIAK